MNAGAVRCHYRRYDIVVYETGVRVGNTASYHQPIALLHFEADLDCNQSACWMRVGHCKAFQGL